MNKTLPSTLPKDTVDISTNKTLTHKMRKTINVAFVTSLTIALLVIYLAPFAFMIATSLKTFRSNQHNEGRCNLYRLGQAYVMLDYGHNAAAFDSLSRIAEQWPGNRVIGVVGVPGDRNDSLIAQAAKSVASAFDRIIVREDHDLRGRQPGEVASILAGAIRETGVGCTICPAVCDAMNLAFEDLQPNDLVIVFFEKLDEVTEHLAKNGAQLASDWPFLPGLVPDQVLRPDFAIVDAEDPA